MTSRFRFLAASFALMTVMAAPAFALDLKSARSSGMVGEKQTGYVEAIKSTPEVKALVSEVNDRRKAEYARISKTNGQPVDVVAKLAYPQIIQKLNPGDLYQGDDGQWKKR